MNKPPALVDGAHMTTYDLICLGCGPAGEKAASQAAYYHRRVAVVERAPLPGGAMVNTGTIPSKALRLKTCRKLWTWKD